MAMTHRWTGRNEADLLAWLRLHCYGGQLADLPRYVSSVLDDDRARDGQFLVVERDGRAVGTATSVDLRMHIGGAVVPCHGVAYVGTIRTERRKGRRGGERGVASEVMWRTVERGRERGDVVSALMPFRASFYEHFGYGVVEQHARWTLPMGVLQTSSDVEADFRPFEAAMLPGLKSLRQRMVAGGQCDLERSEGEWARILRTVQSPGGGFLFVDVGSAGGGGGGGGGIRSWVWLNTEYEAGVAVGRVMDYGFARDDAGALRAMLGFFGSLRDQYARVQLTTPVDWPVPRLISESQVPHRPVAHVTAEVRTYTRMQVRVLDHKRLLEGMRWAEGVRGGVVVGVRESEGHESRFRVEVEGGRASVTMTQASADVTMPDGVWAAVVCGELGIGVCLRWGLAVGEDRQGVLAGLCGGPRPFTWEYF